MNIQPTAMPSLATVGPLPQSTTPPVLFVGHHGCNGGDKSSTKSKPSRALLPKKERLRLGRERDKRRVAALRSQLLRSESAASTPLGENSKYVLQTVAAEAAAAAAAALGCIRHQASDEQADAIATAVHSAVMALATIDVLGRESSSSGEDSDSSAVHASAAEDTARNEHPGSEAVASETPGLVLRPDTVATLGTVPVLNSASPSACILLEGNRRGEVEVGVRELRQLALHDPLEDFNSQDLATAAGPLHFEIFDAADTTWLCAADAAAGGFDCHQRDHNTVGHGTVWTGPGACRHPEHHPSKVVEHGGGTSVTTLVADTASLADEPDDDIPGWLQRNTTAGSVSASSVHYNDLEKSSYCEDTAETACGSEHGCDMSANHQCGPMPINASPRAFDAISSARRPDFNSQNLANLDVPPSGKHAAPVDLDTHAGTIGQCVAAVIPDPAILCGTLPTAASPVLLDANSDGEFNSPQRAAAKELSVGQDMSLKHVNSQNLANSDVHPSSTHASPVLVDTNADTSEPCEEIAGDENPNAHDLDACSSSATDVQAADQHAVHPVGSDAATQACMRELQASVNAMFMQSRSFA